MAGTRTQALPALREEAGVSTVMTASWQAGPGPQGGRPSGPALTAVTGSCQIPVRKRPSAQQQSVVIPPPSCPGISGHIPPPTPRGGDSPPATPSGHGADSAGVLSLQRLLPLNFFGNPSFDSY